jgi:type IX secretion system PorP/SprF family membrane protein
MKKYFLYSISFFITVSAMHAQDPHFSQFFMVPQLLNPATSGTGSGDWRIMSNYRQQWGNAGTPFNTFSFSLDAKLKGKEEGQNTLGGNITFMADQSMDGAFKSVYASGGLAYHQRLNENNRLGIGFQATYGSRRLDYSQLTFGEQFTSGGFDVSLPTGETGLYNMKPYTSISAGLLYGYSSEYLNVDMGVAGFHLNKTTQTFLNDKSQILPIRYVAHMNLEYKASKKLLMNMNAVYQQQSSQHYYAIGGSIGYDVSEGEGNTILYGGGWFRQADAIYPYVSLLFGSVQIGLSYDVTVSSQNKGPVQPKSFELSMIIRQSKSTPGVIPCPWK